MSGHVVIVGERRGGAHRPIPGLYDDPRAYADTMARLGAFTPAQQARIRFVLNHGWDVAMNLLGPSAEERPPWPAGLARRCALVVMARYPESLVVCCGTRVARAFGIDRLLPGEARGGLVRIPHPSGRCRAWNDWDIIEEIRCRYEMSRRSQACSSAWPTRACASRRC